MPAQVYNPWSPWMRALSSVSDDTTADAASVPDAMSKYGPPPVNRIEDDRTAGTRGTTPQSLTTSYDPAAESRAYDPSAGRRQLAQIPLQTQIGKDQAELERMNQPTKQTLLQRVGGVIGTMATAGRGEAAMEQAATLRDRAEARKQQERESLSSRIGTNVRALSEQDIQSQRIEEQERAANLRNTEMARALTSREGIVGQQIAGRAAEGQAGRESRETMEQDRLASQERTAAANRLMKMDLDTRDNAVKKEIAAMRVAAANNPNKISPSILRQAQTSQTILPQIDRIMQETNEMAQQLGPAIGRWNDFWTGKVGVPNPQFANYMADVGYLQSAITLAHSQGRVSNLIFEHFQRLYNVGTQSPENMIEFLKAGRTWLQAYADAPKEIQAAGAAPSKPDLNKRTGGAIQRNPDGSVNWKATLGIQ